MIKKTVLFVCTGNTCRSPMAEGLFKNMLKDKKDITVLSAGTMTFGGMPAAKEAIEILQEENIDISEHCSQQLSEKLIDAADIILTMTDSHKRQILSIAPDAESKTFALKKFDDDADDNSNIPDPIGMGKDIYRNCKNEIKNCLGNLILEVLKEDMTKSIAIGCDHGGYALKEEIKKYLNDKEFRCVDFGCFSEDAVDYPEYGALVAKAVADKKNDLGIAICTTGIGMSIVANKVKGVRASLCHNVKSAEMTKKHNDSNVLILGAGFVNFKEAKAIVDTWINTDFEGGRHKRRVDKISDIEKSC